MRKRTDVKAPGIGKGGHLRLRTHCNAGHEFNSNNTWFVTYGGEAHRRCKICYRLREITYQHKLKQEIIAAYGGKCNWEGCEIIDPDMLVVDHVHDDGVQDRKRPDGKVILGSSLYKKIKKEGFPDHYQVLCSNHNLKKELVRKRKARGATA